MDSHQKDKEREISKQLLTHLHSSHCATFQFLLTVTDVSLNYPSLTLCSLRAHISTIILSGLQVQAHRHLQKHWATPL